MTHLNIPKSKKINSNKLIQLLLLFTTKDWTGFGKLLKNGFIKKMSDDEALLFKELQSLGKRKKLDNFDKIKLGDKLFPNRPKGTIDKTMSPLKEKVEKYFAFVEVMNDNMLSNKLLMQKMEREQFLDLNLQYEKKVVREIEKSPKNTSYYYQMYLLNTTKYFNPITSKENDNASEILLNAYKYLNSFSIIEILICGIEMMSRKRYVRNDTFDLSLVEVIQAHIKQSDWKNDLLIEILSKMYTLLKTLDDKQFFVIKAQIFQHIDEIPLKYRFYMIQFLSNYAGHRYHEDNDVSVKTLFKIYKAGDIHNCLIENKYIEPLFFLNAVDIAIALNEIDWAVSFIEKYKVALSKKNISSYGLALESILLVDENKVSFPDMNIIITPQNEYDKTKIKTILLKQYLEEYILYNKIEHYRLKSVFDNFAKLLQRIDASEIHKVGSKNFLKLTRQIFNQIQPYKLNKLVMKEKIKNTKILVERVWLLSLLDKIKKRR